MCGVIKKSLTNNYDLEKSLKASPYFYTPTICRNPVWADNTFGLNTFNCVYYDFGVYYDFWLEYSSSSSPRIVVQW